jgi:hypothetical protein
MVRILVMSLILSVVVTGCASGSVPTSTTQHVQLGAETPSDALRTLLDAVEEGDVATAATVTIGEQVALLVALDDGTASEAASYLADGIPEESLEMFWSGFKEAYVASFGEDVSDMLIADGNRVTIDLVRFALVDVALRKTSGRTKWIARMNDDGRWVVDLFATFSSTFAQPLRLWLTTMPDSDDAVAVRKAIAAQRPSLLAALQQQPLGTMTAGTAEQIRALMSDVGAGG